MFYEGRDFRIFALIALIAFSVSFMLMLKAIEVFSEKGKVFVAVIDLDMPIVSGEYHPGGCENCLYSEDLINTLDKLIKSEKYKAIVFKINCPGGSAKGVIDIIDYLSSINVTLISFIDGMATSGCYWVSIKSKKIFATNYSIVGGVGVLFLMLDFTGLLKKLGIRAIDVSIGEYKSVWSPFYNGSLNDSERLRYFKEFIYPIYEDFWKNVIKERNIKNSTVIEEIKKSKIFLARDALKMGLVDEICEKRNFKKCIAKELNISPESIEFEEFSLRRESIWDLLLNSFINICSLIRGEIFKYYIII